MLDTPSGRAVLEQVQAALSEGVPPGFQQAVAANAVALALREEELGPALQAAEQARLVALLGRDGSLEELNRALAEAIRDSSLDSPALAVHLVRTTIAKMEIDQPRYPAFKAWKGEAQ